MRKNAREMAALGETLRNYGNYSDAIECFDKAIKADEDYWWAYAHRAAARGALGDFEGAFEDFDNRGVVSYYRKRNWRWFNAQKGEVYRLWAMAATSKREEGDAQRSCYLRPDRLNAERSCSARSNKLSDESPWKVLSSQAIDLFTTALDGPDSEDGQPAGAKPERSKLEGSRPEGPRSRQRSRINNPWILAHRGATYAMRCWIVTDMRGVLPESECGPHHASTFGEDFEKANADLSEAIRLNPTYGWAYLFLAVLHAICRVPCADGKDSLAQIMDAKLRTMDTSMINIGRAQMSGLDRDLAMIRIMMEMAIYTGGELAELTRHPHADIDAMRGVKEKATKTLRDGVQLAWRALQMDSDETLARYFVANGLQQLAELRGVEDPMARVALTRARAALEGMHARYLAMSGGLDCMENNWSAARQKLRYIQELRDLQAITIVNRDPAWARLPAEDA